MFYNCNNIEVVNIMMYCLFSIPIIVLLLFLILDIIKLKKEQMDKKRLYNKIIIKGFAIILLLIIVMLLENKVIKPYITNCNIEVKEIEGKEKEEQLIKEKEREEREKKEKTLQEKIDAINTEIDALEESLSQTELDKIKNEILEIDDVNSQNILYNRLVDFDEYIRLNASIESLKIKFKQAEYYNAYKDIEKISNEKMKDKLLTKISTLGRGKPIQVNERLTSNTEHKIFYYVGTPEHPTENMPLIIFMQPYSCHMELGENSSRYTDEEFFFIAPYTDINSDDLYNGLKEIIDEVVEKYKINKNKIIITGHSNGARSAMHLVSLFPDFFAAIVPIGAHAGTNYNFTAFFGICSEGENCKESMKEFVETANSHGGNARYSIVPGDHSSTGCSFLRSEVLEWVFAQEKK